MKLIKTVLILLGLATLLVGAICGYHAFSGRMAVSADGDHGRLSGWMLQTARESAVARQARQIDAQLPDLDDAELLHETIVGFDDMCAACHTPPGGSPTALARGLNPPPPDLADAAGMRTTEELFWATKYGIRMTGMPAWGKTHADVDLWPIIALITRFPEFADEDYGSLLEAARGAGVEHVHGQGEDHDHGNDHRHEHHNNHEQNGDDHHQHDDSIKHDESNDDSEDHDEHDH